MTLTRRCALILLATALTGCAGNDNQPKKLSSVDRQIPAPKEPPAPPPARPEKLDPALQELARAELNNALNSPNHYIRVNAIEALQQTQGTAAKAVFLKGLTDSSPLIRFACASAVGRLQIAEARETLVSMVNDPNGNVRIWVRFALHRLGDKRFTKDLEQTARTPLIWQYRAQTAEALGLLNEPTAVRVLKPMLSDSEAAVRIQAAEALYRLGDEEGLRALVGATTSAYADDQMIALMGLAARRESRVAGHVRGSLTADWVEVSLVAARVMGILGSDAGYAIAAQYIRSKDPRQRSLSALALGAIGRSDAQGMLGAVLKDPAEPAEVRVSAARALLELKPPPGV